MNVQEIRERWAGESPHRCPECNARPHRESDVLWLLAEVDRLNQEAQSFGEQVRRGVVGDYQALSVEHEKLKLENEKLNRIVGRAVDYFCKMNCGDCPCEEMCSVIDGVPPGQTCEQTIRQYLESEVADK